MAKKFWEKIAQASNVDPDQTAPKEQSEQGLQCLPFSTSAICLCPEIQERLGN